MVKHLFFLNIQTVHELHFVPYKEGIFMFIFLALAEDLSPGPDGKLISTEERMQIIQQQQVESTPEVEKPKPEGKSITV